ncbi:hypothetical protein SAMN05421688_1091 [Poseidonocella pacifica]|uniref:Uncharacterized protein n=1 Tax=Poseidonocella pacifica TaxID=871651 RepID=A0A1I0W971_9RHOB|nr:hypothetical protein SAMN05421688_1091 [Poseidonocella pacifica]
MPIDENLIDYKERSDGRYDVRYAKEPLLVISRRPGTEFRKSALHIIVERHLTELDSEERMDVYRRQDLP